MSASLLSQIGTKNYDDTDLDIFPKKDEDGKRKTSILVKPRSPMVHNYEDLITQAKLTDKRKEMEKVKEEKKSLSHPPLSSSSSSRVQRTNSNIQFSDGDFIISKARPPSARKRPSIAVQPQASSQFTNVIHIDKKEIGNGNENRNDQETKKTPELGNASLRPNTAEAVTVKPSTVKITTTKHVTKNKPISSPVPKSSDMNNISKDLSSEKGKKEESLSIELPQSKEAKENKSDSVGVEGEDKCNTTISNTVETKEISERSFEKEGEDKGMKTYSDLQQENIGKDKNQISGDFSNELSTERDNLNSDGYSSPPPSPAGKKEKKRRQKGKGSSPKFYSSNQSLLSLLKNEKKLKSTEKNEDEEENKKDRKEAGKSERKDEAEKEEESNVFIVGGGDDTGEDEDAEGKEDHITSELKDKNDGNKNSNMKEEIQEDSKTSLPCNNLQEKGPDDSITQVPKAGKSKEANIDPLPNDQQQQQQELEGNTFAEETKTENLNAVSSENFIQRENEFGDGSIPCTTCQQNPPELPIVHYSAALGHSNCIYEMYQVKKASLFSFDNSTRSPLFYACANGQIECVELLLSLSPQLACLGDANGDTPLHAAACSGNDTCVPILVNHPGININAVNNVGMMPSHIGKNKKILELLFEKGADFGSQDIQGRTPLFVACAMNRPDCVAFLLEYLDMSEIIDLPNKKGDTPLHAAALYGHKDCCIKLLEYGAQPELKNGKSLTAIDLARKTKHKKCLKTLLDYKLHHSVNFDTVLFLASLEGHKQLREMAKANEVINTALINKKHDIKLKHYGSWLAYKYTEKNTFYYNTSSGIGTEIIPEEVKKLATAEDLARLCPPVDEGQGDYSDTDDIIKKIAMKNQNKKNQTSETFDDDIDDNTVKAKSQIGEGDDKFGKAKEKNTHDISVEREESELEKEGDEKQEDRLSPKSETSEKHRDLFMAKQKEALEKAGHVTKEGAKNFFNMLNSLGTKITNGLKLDEYPSSGEESDGSGDDASSVSTTSSVDSDYSDSSDSEREGEGERSPLNSQKSLYVAKSMRIIEKGDWIKYYGGGAKSFYYNTETGDFSNTEPIQDTAYDKEGHEWQTYKDETSGLYFYYNTVTGVSQWHKPGTTEECQEANEEETEVHEVKDMSDLGL